MIENVNESENETDRLKEIVLIIKKKKRTKTRIKIKRKIMNMFKILKKEILYESENAQGIENVNRT